MTDATLTLDRFHLVTTISGLDSLLKNTNLDAHVEILTKDVMRTKLKDDFFSNFGVAKQIVNTYIKLTSEIEAEVTLRFDVKLARRILEELDGYGPSLLSLPQALPPPSLSASSALHIRLFHSCHSFLWWLFMSGRRVCIP